MSLDYCSRPDVAGHLELDPHQAEVPKPARPCVTTEPTAQAPRFTELLEQEIPFLRRAALRWGRDSGDPQDLVQDALVRALAHQHQFQPGTNLRAWLVTIMRNQFLAGLAQSKRATVTLDEFEKYEPATAPAQFAALELRDVQQAIARLPIKQRLALLLISVEGRSYEEVALAMETSIGAVRCHVTRARDRLRAIGRRAAEPSSPLARPAAARI